MKGYQNHSIYVLSDKELFSYGGRPKLRAQLGKVDFDQAMTIALLASVSSELSVNEYNSAKAEQLEALAKKLPRRHRHNPQAGGRRSGSQEEGQGRAERDPTLLASRIAHYWAARFSFGYR